MRAARRTAGPTHTRYIGDAAVRIEHLGRGEFDAEISIAGDDEVVWESPVNSSIRATDPDDPDFIDRLAASVVALAVTEGRNARVRRATASAEDEQGYVVERGNPAKRPEKARYLACPSCEANFKLVPGAPFPPHRGLRGDLCSGVGTLANPAGLTAKGERMYEHVKAGYQAAGEPRAKEIAARTVLARVGEGTPGLKKNPNPEYQWFVVTPKGVIFSGWEFKEDADDDKRENGEYYGNLAGVVLGRAPGVKVVSRKTLTAQGINPDFTGSWRGYGRLGPFPRKTP